MIVLERENIPDILLDFLDRENATDEFIEAVKNGTKQPHFYEVTSSNFFEGHRINEWLFTTYRWPEGKAAFCFKLSDRWGNYINSL